MDRAIAALKLKVPPDRQDDVARIVLHLAGDAPAAYRLTADEEADLDEADREIARGEFASDDEVRAIWAKYGL